MQDSVLPGGVGASSPHILHTLPIHHSQFIIHNSSPPMPTPAEIILAKIPLPTHLDSVGLRERWAQRLREQALFSARMTLRGYLERLQGVLAQVADGRLDESAARLALRAKLNELGYVAPGEGLQDAASRARLDLVLRTNRQTAASMAQLARSEDPEFAALFPAWRLSSGGWRRQHRTDWPARWRAAGEAVGWKGAHRTQMVALKASPIWRALGDGVGGFRDTLGNPYPPFAFGSSYGWREVDRVEAIELGLLSRALTVANSRAPFHKCPKCGKFASFDGHCKRCGTTLPTDRMIQRGREALSKATSGNPKDVPRAMHKPGLGTIHFLHGWEGKGEAQEHGKGLAKLLQKHRKELDRLPETIAKGKVYRVKSEKTGAFDDRVRAVIHGSHVAFLSRHGDGWAVTTHYESETKVREVEDYNR